MPKLTKKAIRSERSEGRTDPNHRKASLLKIVLFSKLYLFYLNNDSRTTNLPKKGFILETDKALFV